MKRGFLLFLFSLTILCGCVPLQVDDVSKADQDAYFEGRTTHEGVFLGVCPSAHCVLLFGTAIDVIMTDIYGASVADFFTQNRSVNGANLAAGAAHNETVNGLSAVGVFSLTDRLNAFEIVGGVSVADRLAGVQAAGLAARSRRASGVQLSAGLSTASRLYGVQLGTVAYSRWETFGVQIGAVTVSKQMSHGLQIGLLNRIDEPVLHEIDRITVETADGEITTQPLYGPLAPFASWQFGLLNRTASGWWIPFSNFGYF